MRGIKVVAIVFLLAMEAAWPCLAMGETIADICFKNLTGVEEAEIQGVLPFKVGDEFRIEDLDRGIGYLRKWGVFSTIEARILDSDEGVVVEISFGDARVITNIDVVGNYPYLENKVLKYLTIHTGEVYSPKRIEEQLERIRGFYEREGYVGMEAYTEEQDEPVKNGVAITFHIKRGDLIRYRKIEIQGNRAYPKGRFTSAIGSWRPYSELRLKRSLRSLSEFYRLHGYPRARITILKKDVDYDLNRADVVIGVDEGPHVKAKFVGNHRISKNKLRKTITIFKEGSYDSFEIEASVDAIKDAYRNIGYPDVKVETESKTQKDGTIVISFFIDEGKSRIVKRIDFEGNENVGGKRLRKAIATEQRAFGYKGAFDPELEEKDSDAIRQVYKSEGYLGTEVGSWDVKPTEQGFDLDVKIPIVEGPQTIVKNVEFEGNESASSHRLLKVLKVKPEKPFNELAMPDDKLRLLDYYADHGHPYAKIDQTIVRDESANTVDIFYSIEEGKEVRFGQILIAGDVLTSQKAIRSAMGISTGELFSRKKIIESQLKLRRLGAFSAVTVETLGIADKASTAHVLVSVDEQKPFLVDLQFGYSTDYSFAGSLSFTNLNSFGWAKHTNFKLTGGKRITRGEVGWRDPALVGSSFEMSVIGWMQHEIMPAFDYVQLAGSVSFFRRYRSFGFFFKSELDRNYLVEGNATAADQESLRNNTTAKNSLSASYDTRDSFSNPKKGWYTLGGADFFDEIGGAHANFVQFNWMGENDLTFWKRFTLSSMLRFNNIQTFGKNVSVPTTYLLFLGGDDTIRGYGQDDIGPVDASGNPVGGRVRWIYNEELRIRLFSHFSWAFFFDMGSLTNDYSSIGWDTIRESAGFGLRYATPVGPIRADYGIKLDRKAGESFGRFHLTFGYLF